MYNVTIDRPRPDFRVFMDLLYGAWAVDSDGDAEPVWSRQWTELHMRERKTGAAWVRIEVAQLSPLTLQVQSEDAYLETLSALYLYHYCGIIIKREGKDLTPVDIEALSSPYGIELLRANSSVWHQSSEDTPFPNQKTASQP